MDFQTVRFLTCLILYIPAILHGNVETVDAQGTAEPYLLIASSSQVSRADLNGRNNRTIINRKAVGLDYDHQQRVIYWTDRTKIYRSNVDGTSTTQIIDSDLYSPEEVAWDWINKKLYWLDSGKRTLEVIDPITGFRHVLLTTGEAMKSRPRGLTVDPLNRWVYWSDWGKESEKIVRTSMDGSNSTVLHNNTTVMWPNSLTLDYTTQNLYWVDAKHNHLGSSRSNGSNFQIIQSFSQVLNPYGVTFFEGVVYTSSWKDNSIRSLSLSSVGAGTYDSLLRVARDPNGIKVFASTRQPSTGAGNPCDSSGCEHMCLLSASDPRGYSCICPPGVELSRNGGTCGYEPETTSSELPSIHTPSGPCDHSDLCQNGGTCVNINVSRFVCSCAIGYSGTICEANQKDEQSVTISITTFFAVVGGLVVIVVVMVGLMTFIFVAVKTRTKTNSKDIRTMDSIEGLSADNRNSSTHLVVINGRIAAEHDYMSIKSRANSPGRLLICNMGENGAVPNNYIFEPRPSTSGPGDTADQTIQEERMENTAHTSDDEPLYNTLNYTKTLTL